MKAGVVGCIGRQLPRSYNTEGIEFEIWGKLTLVYLDPGHPMPAREGPSPVQREVPLTEQLVMGRRSIAGNHL